MNRNRIFVIASIIIVLIAASVFVIYFLWKKQPKTEVSKPIIAPQGQSKVTQVKALSLQILNPYLYNDKVLYQGYFQGDLLEANLTTGAITTLMTKNELPEIDKLAASPSFKKALIFGKSKDAANRYFFVNLENRTTVPLDPSIKRAVFISEEKIVYKYLDKTKGLNTINISDPDGKNWKKIINLTDEHIFLNTLGTGEIIYTASETTDNFAVIKPDGSGKRTIKLPAKVNVNKIAWAADGKSAITAIREANKSTDTFYKIDIEKSQKQEIKYTADVPIDAKNLMLTKDGKTLYFTSDDFLYKMGM